IGAPAEPHGVARPEHDAQDRAEALWPRFHGTERRPAPIERLDPGCHFAPRGESRHGIHPGNGGGRAHGPLRVLPDPRGRAIRHDRDFAALPAVAPPCYRPRPMSVGPRLHRLLADDGRCFDVAIDHGLFNEGTFLSGIEDMARAVATIV